MRLLPAGLDAVLVELDGLQETRALQAALAEDPIAGMIEAIPGARTLLIRFLPLLRPSWHDVAKSLHARDLSRRFAGLGQTVVIPVVYDGEDIEEVAALTGLDVAEVVARHAASRFAVAFTGFAPGFAYLTGGDPALVVPRRQSPRARIPKGSVALAGAFSGVYPKASPGGWQIIGTTPLDMFDLERSPASLLAPGMDVRFEPLSNRADYDRLVPAAKAVPAPSRDHDGTHVTVTAAPAMALWQDLGRPGLTGQGISTSGALDRGALRRANAIVGNEAACPCLEFAGGRLGFTVSGPITIAVTGAPCSIEIAPVSGPMTRASSRQAVALDAGDSVTITPGALGVRSYLGVRGGFAVDPVLGSASTDTLAEIGPPAVATGAVIGVRARQGGAAIDPFPPAAPDLPRPGERVAIDIVWGPRTQWFTAQALAQLTGNDWTVTPRSNRVGLRLSGPEGALERTDPGAELPSEATVRGAIQVPHDGQPIVFLADHPLTIGYPVIATIADHHLDLAGQLPAGARIRFRAMGPFADIASQPEGQTP